MLYDHRGNPIQHEADRFTRSLLEKAEAHLLMKSFGRSKFLPFMPLLVDQYGKWIDRGGKGKTIRFRRYQSLKEE